MAANFLHGVETIEIDSGPRAVSLVKTAVVGIIGTAAAGAVNTPILVTSERDFAQFGEDIPNSTIRKALDRIYKQKGTVAIVINVLDPATPVGAKKIKSQAIRLLVDLVDQLLPQTHPLGWVNEAFKH